MMKKLAYSLTGLVLAANAAQAQTVDAAAEATAPGASATVAAEAGAPATPEAEGPAAPAAEASAAADLTETEIDSFAKATVKLQAIAADSAMAEDQKKSAMVAVVTEAGLDAAKYNAIGKAAAADPALRAKVQTAMSKHAGNTDG